jgi:hypothetical protein
MSIYATLLSFPITLRNCQFMIEYSPKQDRATIPDYSSISAKSSLTATQSTLHSLVVDIFLGRSNSYDSRCVTGITPNSSRIDAITYSVYPGEVYITIRPISSFNQNYMPSRCVTILTGVVTFFEHRF